MGAAYSSLGRTKVLYATSIALLGAKVKFLRRKQSVIVALHAPNPIHVISDGYTKVLCRLNIIQSLVV